MTDLPDIASMKLSELKKELTLYGIDSANFCEKQDFTSALNDARENLPRPTTTYHEVEPPQPTEEEIRASNEKQRRASKRSSTSKSSGSSRRHTTTSASSSSTPAPPSSSRARSQRDLPSASSSSSSTPSSAPPQAAPAPTPAPPQKDNKSDRKKLVASRSPVTALQQIREHPSEKLLGERSNTFTPGSPFSFALLGSLREDDAAIIRIPDGVCLKINSASVERKTMENYLLQKGTIGVSLKVSTEENPQLMPIWTFDKEKSNSYTVSDLGMQVCGPRTIRLLAFMEMGFRSGASIDVFVFGSVGLDRDKF